MRVRTAGICGTDLELARGYMSYTGVPGHEFVGEVVDTRTAALAGRRVVGEINAGCGRCALCLDGLGRHCPNRTVLGIVGRDGAFAEYLRLPDENLIALPDSISDELAVFVEPVAAIYEIFEQTGLRRDHEPRCSATDGSAPSQRSCFAPKAMRLCSPDAIARSSTAWPRSELMHNLKIGSNPVSTW